MSPIFAILIPLLALHGCANAQLPFSAEVIDRAMSVEFVSYEGRVGTSPRTVLSSHAFYFLTLVSAVDPSVRGSNNQLVKERALQHLRNVVVGGREPTCSNPLYGWSDGPVALSMTIMRKTPHFWDSLTLGDRARCHWLMKALAVNGNWAFNDLNDYKTGLGEDGNFRKTHNPNYVQGYLGVMIGCSLYFGPDGCDSIFTSFSYSSFMDAFSTFGWSNILSTWKETGASLMERGGSSSAGGSGKGVKIPFVWLGSNISDVMQLFFLQSVKGGAKPMYARTVHDGIGDARIQSGSSPVLGRLGMCYEFETVDSSGLRSDALYSYEGWMNSVITRATMMYLDAWDTSGFEAIEDQMDVGSRDLIYKLSKGYRGVGKFGTRIIDDSVSGEAAKKGYLFNKDIWLNYINCY